MLSGLSHLHVTLEGWSLANRQTIDTAVRLARWRSPALETSGFEFLREVLLPRGVDEPPEAQPEMDPDDRRSGYPPASEAERQERLRVAMKFQQSTAPVQAKGIEDTAFYRYNVLLAANEVGGDPARPEVSPGAFHAANHVRRERFPREMLATATHDAKLGEDVRARLSVLFELTEEWSRGVSRWRRANQTHRPSSTACLHPTATTSIASPRRSWASASGGDDADRDLVARLREYMHKSIKEAKVHTTSINQNRAYDAATARFVERSLTGAGGARFLPLLLPLTQRVARLGIVNSLAQVALKLTSPGVPDFYQGTSCGTGLSSIRITGGP